MSQSLTPPDIPFGARLRALRERAGKTRAVQVWHRSGTERTTIATVLPKHERDARHETGHFG